MKRRTFFKKTIASIIALCAVKTKPEEILEIPSTFPPNVERPGSDRKWDLIIAKKKKCKYCNIYALRGTDLCRFHTSPHRAKSYLNK